MIIGIDFDGTIVKHDYPLVGDAVPHALRVMRRLLINDHKIILWTMRSDAESEDDEDMTVLDEAVEYCRSNGIELFGVNKNPEQYWSTSPKAYCQIYIDDAALGCPLLGQPDPETTYIPDGSEPRPYVDWMAVEYLLMKKGFFDKI